MHTLKYLAFIWAAFLAIFFVHPAHAAPPKPAPAAAAPVDVDKAVFAGMEDMSQVDLAIGVGSSKGTYAEMVTQMISTCKSDTLSLSGVITKGGTMVSLDRLLNNELDLAPLTDDVLWARQNLSKDPRVSDLRILFPLYMAEVHPFGRRMDNTINKFSDMAGKVIGVYGGAEITSQVLFALMDVHPGRVDTYSTEQGLLEAVSTSKVQAGIIVVGQPAKWAKEMDPTIYKLLPVDNREKTAKAGYVEGLLNYSNLSTEPIPTVAVQVSFMTYDYQGPKAKSLVALRECVQKNKVVLRETRGNHMKWREVDASKKSKLWPMFMASAQTSTPASGKKSNKK